MDHNSEFRTSIAEAFASYGITKSPVTTYHPRLDIPNSAAGEIFVTSQMAQALGQDPTWVPYTYDFAYSKGAANDRAAVHVYFENNAFPVLSSSRVGAMPVSALDGFKAGDIKSLASNIDRQFQDSMTHFQQQIASVRLGHPLFHMKGKQSIQGMKASFKQSLSKMQEKWNGVVAEKSLSDQFIKLNCAMSEEFLGIKMDSQPIDHILSNNDELVENILSNYAKTQDQVEPSLKVLVGEERRPITDKDGTFNDGHRDYTKDELKNLIKDKKITISGELFLAALNFLGHQATVGGSKTASYYGGMFAKAQAISESWDHPFTMKYILYDGVNVQDNFLNVIQTASTLNVVNDIAERTMQLNGSFNPKADIAQDLVYTAGIKAVPAEFAGFVKNIPAGENALQKNEESWKATNQLINDMNANKMPEDAVLADLAKKYKCPQDDAGYIRKSLENDRTRQIDYLNTLRSRSYLQSVFLGGTVNGNYQNGVMHRSARFPTVCQFMLLEAQNVTTPKLVLTDKNKSEYCVGTIMQETKETGLNADVYDNAFNMFQDMFKPAKLPFSMLKS